MPNANVIEGVSGFVTEGRKSTSMASSGSSSKRSTPTTPKTSSVPTSVPPSTVKRCTVCPVPHNSSTAYERRLGLIRRPGTPSLFHRLAPELRALVYPHLAATDVLRLRLTCRSLRNLIELDVNEVIRCLAMEDGIIRLAHSLARCAINTSTLTVRYLVALSHQCHVAETLGQCLAISHLKELYACNSIERSPHARKVHFMVGNLRPYLLIISRMLEAYRSSVAKIVREKLSVEEMRLRACSSECDIMKQYASNDRVSLVFEFLKKILFRQLRPASYATFVERRIRGWTEPSANEDKVMPLMIFGGTDAVNKVLNSPTYNNRIRALEDWLSKAGVSELSRPATNQRMKAILPDRSHFFNKWARIDARGQEDSTLELRPLAFAKPDPGEFQLWLKTEDGTSDLVLQQLTARTRAE
ncbi:MAG: hypothetical protein Q9226_004994 [Calogaya cf. arnoldii]